MKHLSRDSFLATFGGIYEHSTWIAEMLFDRDEQLKAEKPSDLAGPMANIVETAPQELQLALLRAYPDFLTATGTITIDSASERTATDLDHCTNETLKAFTDLNAQYRDKFNFPFILAVRERNWSEILENFNKRISHDVGTEFREALNQIHQIAKLRLEALDT